MNLYPQVTQPILDITLSWRSTRNARQMRRSMQNNKKDGAQQQMK